MSHHFKNNHRFTYRSTVKGFTLVELLVSLGIISVILSMVVFNQNKYTDAASLSLLADEISQTVSQAQAYGIAVRELSPGTADFTVSYGITLSILTSGSNVAYLFFADRNDNNLYDGDWTCPLGGASECLEKVAIRHGNYIDSLCVIRENDTDLCNVGRLDVSFVRPKTEAQILFFDTSGAPLNPAGSIGVRVVLKSPSGNIQTVVIYETGQVSVTSTYEYQYPTPPYLYPTPYTYPYPTPYVYEYQYQYQYPTPYAYPYPYPTPSPTPTITYNGPTSGTHVIGSGPLNLTTAGTYTITVNVASTVSVKGVAGGGGGQSGGKGGGGGASNASGISTTLNVGITYTAMVGAGGGANSAGGKTEFRASGTSALELNGGGGGGSGGAGGTVLVGGGQSGGTGGVSGYTDQISGQGTNGGGGASGGPGGGGGGGGNDERGQEGGYGGGGGASGGGGGTSGGAGSNSSGGGGAGGCYICGSGGGGGGGVLGGYGGGGGGGSVGSGGIGGVGGRGAVVIQ